jgi:tetratricopeptide (TPR) repeat protein
MTGRIPPRLAFGPTRTQIGTETARVEEGKKMRKPKGLLAAVLFLSATAWAQVPPTPDAALVDAVELQEEGRHEEARALYARILAERPEHPAALAGIALASLVLGDFEASERYGTSRLRLPEPAPAGVFVLVANAQALQGKGDAAAATLESGKAAWPIDETIRYQGGILRIALGRYGEAVDDFAFCLERSPYRADYWRAIGDALAADGAKGRAFAAYARSLTLDAEAGEAKGVADEMWELLFDDVRVDRSFTNIAAPAPDQSETRYRAAAETMGVALVAALRQDDRWREQTDAAFFAYALDTILKLVSAIHEPSADDRFWREFLFAYFDGLRDAGHLETLAYDIRRAAEDPDAVAWGRTHRERMNRFRSWSERWAVNRTGDPLR